MNTFTKIFLLISLLISMTAISVYAVNDQGEDSSSIQLRGIGRFLAATNCNVNHKICKANGSPRQDCCNNMCVDNSSDHLNCGKCGHKCSFSQTCCKGKCVNSMNDRDNCGSCSNKCQHHDHKKSHCVFGTCNYA